MSSLEKNAYPIRLRRISVMIGNGYCLRLMTLLSCRRSLIQRTLPSFFGMMNVGDAHSLSCCRTRTPMVTKWSSSFLNVLRCIQGIAYGLAYTGFAVGSTSMWNFLCGYTPRVPSNIFACRCNNARRSSFKV